MVLIAAITVAVPKISARVDKYRAAVKKTPFQNGGEQPPEGNCRDGRKDAGSEISGSEDAAQNGAESENAALNGTEPE